MKKLKHLLSDRLINTALRYVVTLGIGYTLSQALFDWLEVNAPGHFQDELVYVTGFGIAFIFSSSLDLVMAIFQKVFHLIRFN